MTRSQYQRFSKTVNWDAEYTCKCSKTGKGYYVQPQPDGTAICTDCHNAAYHRYKAERKAQLDAMPRCEVPGCKRRASKITVGNLGLCGAHFQRAERKTASAYGIFGLCCTPSRDEILMAAQE